MSKQPHKSREALAKLKAGGFVLPDERNPQQCWLLVVMHPMDNKRGEVFITHAHNFKKFDNRRGFEVICHSFDKEAIQLAQRKLTLRLGPAYQPPHSAHNQAHRRPQPEQSDVIDPTAEQPSDLSDFIGSDDPNEYH